MQNSPMTITRASNSSVGMEVHLHLGISNERVDELVKLSKKVFNSTSDISEIIIKASSFCQNSAELAYVCTTIGMYIERNEADCEDEIVNSDLPNVFTSLLSDIFKANEALQSEKKQPVEEVKIPAEGDKKETIKFKNTPETKSLVQELVKTNGVNHPLYPGLKILQFNPDELDKLGELMKHIVQ